MTADAVSAEVKRETAAAQAFLSLVACQHTNEHTNDAANRGVWPRHHAAADHHHRAAADAAVQAITRSVIDHLRQGTRAQGQDDRPRGEATPLYTSSAPSPKPVYTNATRSTERSVHRFPRGVALAVSSAVGPWRLSRERAADIYNRHD